MKIKFVICFCLIVIASACHKKDKKSLISYVNLLIGTDLAATPSASQNPGDHVDYGQTIPAVTAPFGMTQWTPQNLYSEQKCIAPFYIKRSVIQGFRASHWTSGSCVQDYGSFTLMPVDGEYSHLPWVRETESLFNQEYLSPASSTYYIPQYHVITEITATKRCGFFRFTWSYPESKAILFDVNNDEGKGYIQIDPERKEIIAANPVNRIYAGQGKTAGFSGYMVAKLDCDFEQFGTFCEQEKFKDSLFIKDRPVMGAWINVKSKKGDVVHVKIGTSFTSVENARKNLEQEIPGWDFNRVRLNLENEWNNLFDQIQVQGGSDDDLSKFYTAIYHSCLHPRLFSDVDGSYPAFGSDSTIHTAREFDYYCDFSAWDTYRAQMPLVSLLAPKAYEDMIKSLIVKAEQGNWMPIFPMWNSYTSAMIGDHCSAIIGDAYMKGFRFDIEKAWAYMKKNAFEIPSDYDEYVDGKGRRSLRTYLEFGYIPLEDEVIEAFHKREQVSRTLEYAYDDWVLSKVAEKMGKQADARELSNRALNYVNVFDQAKGWVCGRYTDGNFTDDFNAHRPVSWITEGTPAQYTWYVPQDVQGLMELMGGKDAFLHKLQGMVDNNEFWHGNEPSHHVPYLFNYVDRWDLTQKTVKELLNSNYSNNPGGISGNDDSGQLSAWYVFSAMGFYPVCPGSNEYQLSSPVFRKITLNLDKNYYPGKKFIIQTRGNDRESIFTKVRLNGKETGTIITHNDLRKGGKLLFK